MISRIKNTFLSERENWILWLPVFFGLGIAAFFSLNFEPQLKYSALTLFASITLTIAAYKNRLLLWSCIALSLAIGGFFTANLRTTMANAPILQKETRAIPIAGKILQIHTHSKGYRFILGDLKITNLSQEQTPERIRINVNTNPMGAQAGDTISTLAVLSPPPKPVLPGAYDFSRFAYFHQIGAVGYAVANITILQKNTGLAYFISTLRQTITHRILQINPDSNGHIMTALLVGEKGGIALKDLDNMRDAGLAHLLAISGMHLVLVVTIFFILTRLLLASIEPLAIRYNIKKWAVFVAIAGSFFYLLISGMPISAQRAFIMSSLVLIAILLDRNGTPLRSVALAAMIVMLIAPESILTPSFQMSFAAAIALISGFEALKPFFQNYREYSISRKITLYVFGMMASSTIAGFATAPFALYHFSNFATYGILANLVAIPVTSFIIMPAGVLALICMPFGLELLPLSLMSWGVSIVTHLATYITSLPQAFTAPPSLPLSGVILITLGGLWLLMWKTRLRLFGYIPITLGLTTFLSISTPNLIIDEEGKLFAAKDQDVMIFSSNRMARYSRERWQQKFGIEYSQTIDKTNSKVIRCDKAGCIYQAQGRQAAITKSPLALAEDCSQSNLIINLTHVLLPCRADHYISKNDLKYKGTHMVYFTRNGLSIQNVSDYIGNRAWNR